MASSNLIEITRIGKNITIRKTGKKLSSTEILKNLGVYNKMNDITNEALLYMQNYLMTHAKHPSGKLLSNLDIVIKETASGYIFGIGDIPKLNTNAPYWYVLNYGKTTSGAAFIPPKFIGSFEGDRPVAGKQGEQAVTGGNFFIQPTKFTPVNYIEATLAYIKNRMRTTLKKSRGFTRASLPQV